MDFLIKPACILLFLCILCFFVAIPTALFRIKAMGVTLDEYPGKPFPGPEAAAGLRAKGLSVDDHLRNQGKKQPAPSKTKVSP
jgi:hypothetical protein